MKQISTPDARPRRTLVQRARTGDAARFERCNRDASSGKFRTRRAGRASTGALAASFFVLIVVCALVFYLFRHDPTAAAKANGAAAPTNSGHRSSNNTTAADSQDTISDSSNRERIIPGSNLSPPTVDYSRNPADAGQRSRGDGSYGSDMSGGGSPGPN